MNNAIYSIGHSTRTIEEFVKTLQTYNIERVNDVRSIPKSRHNPQFNIDELRKSLSANKIEYLHLAKLGGLRHTTKESINTAWKNLSFRGYADYMQTIEFKEEIKKLIKLADRKRTVIMCSEAVPWRCHRSLIGDALLIRKICVKDIISGRITKHTLTPWAKVKGNSIYYPVLKHLD